jgi:hypothetical protein
VAEHKKHIMYRTIPWVHFLLAIFSVVGESYRLEKLVQSRGDGETDPRGNCSSRRFVSCTVKEHFAYLQTAL